MHRPGRVLIYFLVAAHVAAGAALIALAFGSDLRVHSSAFDWDRRWFAIAGVVGASFAQTSLAVWWTVMGRRITWPVRAAVPIGVCTIWARVLSVATEAPAVRDWVLYVGLAVAMLWLLVPWRMVTDATREIRSNGNPSASRVWQFDLRGLLRLVLAAACTFAFARWCVHASETWMVWLGWAFSCGAAATGLVVLWAFRGAHRVIWRLPAAIAVAAVAAWLMWWLDGAGGDQWWFYPVVFVTEAFVIAATMAVLHVAARQPTLAVADARSAATSTALRGPEFG